MESELKQYLEAMETRLTAHVDARVEKSEHRLVEKMRDMQTELLRGFAGFSEGRNIRLRKLEADNLQDETRLGGAGRN
jgi:hypothetical protein